MVSDDWNLECGGKRLHFIHISRSCQRWRASEARSESRRDESRLAPGDRTPKGVREPGGNAQGRRAPSRRGTSLHLKGSIRGEVGQPIEVGGSDDHVPVLTHLRADRALSEVLRRVKSSITGWVHSNIPERHNFAWQAGYAAFTVSQSHLERVRSYISVQVEHHKKRSFQEELEQLFEKHGIKPDSRFWER